MTQVNPIKLDRVDIETRPLVLVQNDEGKNSACAKQTGN